MWSTHAVGMTASSLSTVYSCHVDSPFTRSPTLYFCELEATTSSIAKARIACPWVMGSAYSRLYGSY